MAKISATPMKVGAWHMAKPTQPSTAKEVDGGADAKGKGSRVKDREFAQEVLALLGGFVGEPPTGPARSKEEKLAATLHCVMSLLKEYVGMVHSHSANDDFMRAEAQRMKIAQDAIVMLADVANKRRHPIHKFFSGCAEGLKSRTNTSSEMKNDCRMIACLDEILRLGAPYGTTQTAAIKMMMRKPAIMAHMQNRKRFENLLQNHGADEDYIETVNFFKETLLVDCGVDGPTIDRVLEITDLSLQFGNAPPMFEEATRVRRHRVIQHSPDGRAAFLPRKAIPFLEKPPTHLLALGQGKKAGA